MATQQARWRWATNWMCGGWRGYKSDLAGYSLSREARKEMSRRACVQLTHGREKGRWEEARQDKRTGGPHHAPARSELLSRIWATSTLRNGDACAACPATRGPIGSPASRPDATVQPHHPRRSLPPRARQRHRGSLRKKGCNKHPPCEPFNPSARTRRGGGNTTLSFSPRGGSRCSSKVNVVLGR